MAGGARSQLNAVFDGLRWRDDDHGTSRGVMFRLLALVTLVLADSAGVTPETGAQPEEALVIVVTHALIAEERSQAICIVVSDGKRLSNLSTSAHELLRERYPQFAECQGSTRTFTIGPASATDETHVLVDVRRISADSPCRYQATRRSGRWRLKKEPCLTM
jgi:hypothetical protein